MFSWYAGCHVCYAYLADFEASRLIKGGGISGSRWFSRGWTLQELIAPALVRFYDKSWESVGTKASLSRSIASSTGIGEDTLCVSPGVLTEHLNDIPIAVKMSWAADRETSRIEDTAYCLLGLFGINLPLLYGEGERSFIRLQEEIVRNSNDLSLLAWRLPQDTIYSTSHSANYCGVFAPHPQRFRDSQNIKRRSDLKFVPDFTNTNKGLKIQSELYYDRLQGLHVLELNSYSLMHSKRLGILLKHHGAGVFVRAKPENFAFLENDIGVKNPTVTFAGQKTLFLSKIIASKLSQRLDRIPLDSFVVPTLKNGNYHLVAAKPEALWDSVNETYVVDGLYDFLGFHQYAAWKKPDRNVHLEPFVVLFGRGYSLLPWVRVSHTSESWNLFDQLRGEENWRRLAHKAYSSLSQEPLRIGKESCASKMNPKKGEESYLPVYVTPSLNTILDGTGSRAYKIELTIQFSLSGLQQFSVSTQTIRAKTIEKAIT